MIIGLSAVILCVVTAAIDLATVFVAVATVGLAAVTLQSVRVAKQQFGRQLLPVLIPSRVREPRRETIFSDGSRQELWSDQVYVSSNDALYVAIPLRNIGSGIAVVSGFSIAKVNSVAERAPERVPNLEGYFHSKTDLYLAPGDIAHLTFYSSRNVEDTAFKELLDSVTTQDSNKEICMDILYSDHARGQEAVTRIALSRGRAPSGQTDQASSEIHYIARAIKHWRLWRRPGWLPAAWKREWQCSVDACAKPGERTSWPARLSSRLGRSGA